MNETSDIFMAMATIAPLAAFFVSFGICFCKLTKGQKLLYKYVKSFKHDFPWPLDYRLTKRYQMASRVFAFYLYGTCKTKDKHLESLRVCNLANEFHLTALLTVILLALVASCVVAFAFVLFFGDNNLNGKITGCAYSLTLILFAKLIFSRFIKRRLLFYRKLLLFFGMSGGELCKKLFFRFFVVYAIIGAILVVLMMPRNREETKAAILVQPGMKLQGQPAIPPKNHSMPPHVEVAGRPLLQSSISEADVAALDAIADFLEANRGCNDGKTFSELNQLLDDPSTPETLRRAAQWSKCQLVMQPSNMIE